MSHLDRKFGPYNKALIIAIRVRENSHGEKVCTLGYAEQGTEPKWEKEILKEESTTVFRLAAHHACEVRIAHHDGEYSAAFFHCASYIESPSKTALTKTKAPNDPPPPPANQVCDCVNESKTCGLSAIQDCNDPAVCVPIRPVVKKRK